MYWRFLIISLLVVFPGTISAAVRINEVSWMGSSVSANHEWIELYNDGATESVEGWVLTDGANLSITLSGTISSNSFALLERTSDDSAAGSAFFIYTGALVNTGATLVLRRTDGTVADQVSGGDAWSGIGGDNVTKATAQYTAGGWVTAAATPGDTNATVSDEVPEDEADEDEDTEEETDEDESETVGTNTRSASPKVLVVVPSEPAVRITMPAQVYVNQLVEAEALVSNVGKVIDQSMVRSWNFGDATTGTGKEVSHRFAYPGEYIVSVRATYKNYTAHDKVVVTVLPTSLSLTINDAGDVQLHNNAKYEVDISGYAVTAGKTVVLPPDTFMRPRGTITFARAQIAYAGQVVIVTDDLSQHIATSRTSGIVSAATADREEIVSFMAAPVIVSKPSTIAKLLVDRVPETTPFIPGVSALTSTGLTDVVRQEQPQSIPTTSVTNLNSALVADAATPISKASYPYLALGAVIVIGLLAVASGRVRTPLEVATDESAGATESFPFR